MNDETQLTAKTKDDSQLLGVSVRGWLAFMIVLTVCAMSLIGLTVSEPLYTLAAVSTAFYFGQKTHRP